LEIFSVVYLHLMMVKIYLLCNVLLRRK